MPYYDNVSTVTSVRPIIVKIAGAQSWLLHWTESTLFTSNKLCTKPLKGWTKLYNSAQGANMRFKFGI